MDTSEFVAAAQLKATGETFSGTTSDTDGLKTIGIGNYYIRTWAREKDVDWTSLYDPEFVIGTVTATSTFDLDTDSIRKLSATEGDYVRIDHTDGVHWTNYEIVDADKLKNFYTGNKKNSYGNYCAQIASTLVFNRTFKSTDPQFGGTIKAPIYGYPDAIVNDTDTVPVDDPNWLVTITAAELVRNDITKQNQYPNLINEANQLMERMVDDNDTSQVDTVIKVPVGRGTDW